MNRELDRWEMNERLEACLSRVGRTVVVLSGKGGVGKSTVAVNLAAALSRAKHRVGLLDVDIHGPSVPRMLGLSGRRVLGGEHGLEPIRLGKRLSVMSIGFLLADVGDAVIWRGPRKFGAIRQFIADVDWGDLDFLVVDAPPGTGDEPLAVCELTEGKGERGAVVVTTPQEVALADVRKCIRFCAEVSMPVFGVVENMSFLECPHCGGMIDLFHRGGGEKMAAEKGVPFLGRIPMVPEVVESGDLGRPVVLAGTSGDSRTAAVVRAFEEIAEGLEAAPAEGRGESAAPAEAEGPDGTCYAVPTEASGRVSGHFGHCERFTLFTVTGEGGIASSREIEPPAHEPGVLPRWLADEGADIVLCGGIGSRAREMLEARGVRVVTGVGEVPVRDAVLSHLRGDLVAGDNACSH